jgi:hypothetical protein
MKDPNCVLLLSYAKNIDIRSPQFMVLSLQAHRGLKCHSHRVQRAEIIFAT